MTKILGLDVSSSCTGYCIVCDGYLDLNSLGTIEPPSDLTVGEKLVYFEKAVKKLIKKFQPDDVMIEDIFKGPNAKTFKLLAMFRGVAFKTIQEKLKKDPESVMPTEARSRVGVIGGKKENAFAWVIEKYNFKDFTFNKHNDICDGIILALSYFSPQIGPTSKKKAKNKRKSDEIKEQI